jgi:hypothetical protein
MFAGERVFPNAYIAVFGGTGDKKTTAMRRPRSAGLLKDIRVISNLGSTEGLADALQTEVKPMPLRCFFLGKN